MSTTSKKNIDVENNAENNSDTLVTQKLNNTTKDNSVPVVDPQVKSNKPRRSFDRNYKARILAAYDACSDSHERSAFLRREGLYYACIPAWRREIENGKTNPKKNNLRIDHLTRENEQLKKKLAQAEAIIDLQKKVSELLGQHILPHDKSEKI